MTIITEDVHRAARFYRDIVGLRCVKRTVDYDDPTSHHLYFGDDLGRAGSLLTLFEWAGLPSGRPGIGTIRHVALRLADAGQLAAVAQRAASAGALRRRETDAAVLSDPDGCEIELTAPAGAPPPGGVHLDHVLAVARDLQHTAEWCERILGLTPSARGEIGGDHDLPVWSFGPSGSLRYCAVRLGGKPVGHVGPGIAHHVAFSVPSEEALQGWVEHLRAHDVPATPAIDRHYFRSVYLRDPDANVLELATHGPGLALDESADDLGGRLRLPPWLEPRRAELVAGLSGL